MHIWISSKNSLTEQVSVIKILISFFPSGDNMFGYGL